MYCVNVIVTMVQFGRGKEKTNRQVVPIMVLLGTDGPVITGLEHVTAHSFGCRFPTLERERIQCKLKPEHVCTQRGKTATYVVQRVY